MYKNKEKQLKKQLKEAENNGVSLFLEGRPATPKKIADMCLKEDTVYMADYVVDEEGKWKELRYDRIEKWK